MDSSSELLDVSTSVDQSSKVPNLICDGLLLEGITGPEAIKVLAAMVPPLGITFSLVLYKITRKRTFIQHRKKKY